MRTVACAWHVQFSGQLLPAPVTAQQGVVAPPRKARLGEVPQAAPRLHRVCPAATQLGAAPRPAAHQGVVDLDLLHGRLGGERALEDGIGVQLLQARGTGLFKGGKGEGSRRRMGQGAILRTVREMAAFGQRRPAASAECAASHRPWSRDASAAPTTRRQPAHCQWPPRHVRRAAADALLAGDGQNSTTLGRQAVARGRVDTSSWTDQPGCCTPCL